MLETSIILIIVTFYVYFVNALRVRFLFYTRFLTQ